MSHGTGYIARLSWPYWNKKYGPFLKYWLYSSTFLSGYITYYAMDKIDLKLSLPVQPNFPGSIAKYCLLYNQIFWAQSSFLPMLRRTQIQPAEGLDSWLWPGPEVPPLIGLRTLIVVSIKKRDLERFHCLEKYRVLILQCLHICKFKRKF